MSLKFITMQNRVSNDGHNGKPSINLQSLGLTFCLVLMVLCSVFVFNSCKLIEKHRKTEVRIEYRDSIVYSTKLDSIYLYEKDSIFIKEKADTVFVERWSVRYRDVLKEKHDTVFFTDIKVDTLVEYREQIREVPKPLTAWQRFQKNGFWALLVIVLGICLYFGYKFYKKLKG